jgi:menaquinone-dependent protoporphyrinogen oxidase
LVLVGYATRYGSTQEVAEAIGETLREQGLEVEVRPMRDVRALEEYGAVVLGAALYMYRWHKDARRFLSRHRKALAGLPVAIFALGPVKEPHDEEEWRNSRAQLDKELAGYGWLTPVAIEILGGKFDPETLRFPLNLFAGSEPASDIRDWAAIRAWASSLTSTLAEA